MTSKGKNGADLFCKCFTFTANSNFNSRSISPLAIRLPTIIVNLAGRDSQSPQNACDSDGGGGGGCGGGGGDGGGC